MPTLRWRRYDCTWMINFISLLPIFLWVWFQTWSQKTSYFPSSTFKGLMINFNSFFWSFSVYLNTIHNVIHKIVCVCVYDPLTHIIDSVWYPFFNTWQNKNYHGGIEGLDNIFVTWVVIQFVSSPTQLHMSFIISLYHYCQYQAILTFLLQAMAL